MPNPTLKAWDRQPTESDQAFHAFKIYRDLGTDRSLSRVASELITGGRSKGNVRTVRTNLGVWSVKYRWVERSAAWDRHLDMLDQVQQQKDRRDMRRRQANMAQAIQAGLSIPAQAMAAKFESNRDLVRDLAKEDVGYLVELMSKSARVLPGVVGIERVARGEDVELDEAYTDDEVFADRVGEEERLRRVAAIMHEHGLLPPAPADIVIEAPDE